MGSRVAIKIGCFASTLKIDMADTNSLIVNNFPIKNTSSQIYKLEEFQNIWIIYTNPNPKTNYLVTGKKLIGVRNVVD